MDNYLIPKGYSDYIPTESKQHSKLLQQLSNSYESHGFSLITTPTVELVSSLEVAMAPNLRQQSIKFFDSHGQLVTLRPDHTVPIARIVSTRMTSVPLPIKLYYQSPIFRQPQQHHSHNIETFQSGIEYIGESSMLAEATIIQTCIDALTQAGLDQFHIDIGHTDFIHGLNDSDQAALLNGDYFSLGYIPQRGDIQSVGGHKQLERLHNYLNEFNLSHHVTYNKGLVKGIHYYTGTLFEIYTKDTKQIIASGGRYDTLLNQFGYNQPAVGLAFNLTLLLEQLS